MVSSEKIVKSSIVGILGITGNIVGTGFVVTDSGLIVTCVHVIDEALPKGAKRNLNKVVNIKFYSDKEVFTTSIECEDSAMDVAILRLDKTLPKGVKRIPVCPSETSVGHTFRTYGYPTKLDDGLGGTGSIKDITKLQGIQPVLQLQSQEVSGGFSGAPVWDENIQGVVGMITNTANKDDRGRQGETAFAVVSEVLWGKLREIFPEFQYSEHQTLNTALEPISYVNRSTQFNQIVTYLLSEISENQHGHIIVLQGGGGFGKTTLAQKICHYHKVKETFNDGILWITLGTNPNLLELARDQIETLTRKRSNFSQPEPAFAHLKELLIGRRILLVLDDVWDENHVKPFLTQKPDFYCLITTRLQSLTSWFQMQTVEVNEMTIDEAVELLATDLDVTSVEQAKLYEFGKYLGGWPLLLNLSAAYLRLDVKNHKSPLINAIQNLKNRLDRKGFTYFDRANETERNRAISVSLSISLERLSQWKERYLELAIFPEGIDIPFTTIERLWKCTAKFDDIESEDTFKAIQNLSLFNRYDPVAKTIKLHHVIRSCLIDQKKEDLGGIHSQLLNTYFPTTSSPLIPIPGNLPITWADLPPNETYMWFYLIYHLSKAGRIAELVSLVKDLRYIATKVYLCNAYAAEKDLEVAKENTSNDKALQGLHRSLKQCTQILNRCENINDLFITLYNRLLYVKELSSLVEQLTPILSSPYLISRYPLPDLPPPERICTLDGHEGVVNGCVVSSDDKLIVSACSDQTLRIWNSQTGQRLLTLKGHESPVNDCAISSDGRFIVSASDDQTLKIWDAQTGQCLQTLVGHEGSVRGCCISPDGTFAVSTSEDCTLKVWDISYEKEPLTLRGHKAWVNHCAISSDGRFIVSASDDQTLKIWDAQTGQCLQTLVGHEELVSDCAISSDGRFIISASDDQTLKIWDAQTGEEKETLTGHETGVRGCDISLNGKLIVSIDYGGVIKGWKFETQKELLILDLYTNIASNCAVSSDGTFIVSAHHDQTLKVWDTTPKQEHKNTHVHTNILNDCAICSDGTFIVAASYDATLKVWDAQTGEELRTLVGHIMGVNGCAISSDGTFIVSASLDGTLKVWNSFDGEEMLTLSGHEASINSCAISPDGNFIVSASYDQTLKIWDAQTGKEKETLVGHKAAVEECAVSSDGTFIVSASLDGTLKIWDTRSGHERLTLPVHKAFVSNCAISPNGSIIASAYHDGTLKIWDTQNGQEKLTLRGHTGVVSGCDFSSDGLLLLSASWDQSLKLWDTQSGYCLASLYVDASLLDCAWSLNGQYIAAVSTFGIYSLKLQI